MLPDFQEKIKGRGVGDIFWPVAAFLGVIALVGAFRLYQIRSGYPAEAPVIVRNAFQINAGVPADERAFVGSKSGKNYYPVPCAAARRIKEENRIYFASASDAEQAGFVRAKSC